VARVSHSQSCIEAASVPLLKMKRRRMSEAIAICEERKIAEEKDVFWD